MSVLRQNMPDAPVICNTSPLIKLAGVGLLDLLPHVYGDIWIPDVVRQEYDARAHTADPDLRTFPWLTVHPVQIDPVLHTMSGFGAGEAAVIALAEASQARLVLLDDKRARRVAASRGLAIVGTLGVLVRACKQGHLPAVRPVIDAMAAQGRSADLAGAQEEKICCLQD
jgi:hypothetical protein